MKTQLLTLMLKIKTALSGFIALILAFLLPIQPLLLIVGACIFMDTLFGILRARKTKEAITSRRLSKVVSKMVLYQSAVILFFCLEKFILGDFVLIFTAIPLFLTKLVAGTLALIEVKSINENYTVLSGVSLWSKFKEILSRGKEIKKELDEFKDNQPGV